MDFTEIAKTALSSVLGGSIVVLLMRERLAQYAELRSQHDALKKEVDQEHKTQLDRHERRLDDLHTARIRNEERLAAALEKLSAVDFGAWNQQLRTMGVQIEALVQAERLGNQAITNLIQEVRTQKERVDRAHSKADELAREVTKINVSGCRKHGGRAQNGQH